MKKMTASILALACAITLSSCAGSKSDGGNAAVSAEGNCTEETISTYNDIYSKARSYTAFKDKAYLTGMINSCTKLQSLLGTQTCKALDTKTNETTSITYSSVSTVCDSAKNIK